MPYDQNLPDAEQRRQEIEKALAYKANRDKTANIYEANGARYPRARMNQAFTPTPGSLPSYSSLYFGNLLPDPNGRANGLAKARAAREAMQPKAMPAQPSMLPAVPVAPASSAPVQQAPSQQMLPKPFGESLGGMLSEAGVTPSAYPSLIRDPMSQPVQQQPAAQAPIQAQPLPTLPAVPPPVQREPEADASLARGLEAQGDRLEAANKAVAAQQDAAEAERQRRAQLGRTIPYSPEDLAAADTLTRGRMQDTNAIRSRLDAVRNPAPVAPRVPTPNYAYGSPPMEAQPLPAIPVSPEENARQNKVAADFAANPSNYASPDAVKRARENELVHIEARRGRLNAQIAREQAIRDNINAANARGISVPDYTLGEDARVARREEMDAATSAMIARERAKMAPKQLPPAQEELLRSQARRNDRIADRPIETPDAKNRIAAIDSAIATTNTEIGNWMTIGANAKDEKTKANAFAKANAFSEQVRELQKHRAAGTLPAWMQPNQSAPSPSPAKPATGKPAIGFNADKSEGVSDQSIPPANMPNARHIAALRANPSLAPMFDQKFGPGASSQYLGQ